MSNGLITVTAATGNIGKVLSETLLTKGAKVRVVGRNVERLDALKEKRAETFVGSIDDSAAMTKAFTNAEVVFALTPPNMGVKDFRAYQNQVGTSVAAGITAAKVPNVVHLSSVGANLSQGVGPVNGLYDNEQRLNSLEGVNVLHLRPVYFMENLLFNVGMIKGMGFMGSPLKADLSLPMIATKDIAAVAARLILALDFKGTSVHDLQGPREYTMSEVTKVLGAAIGKPDLKYVQFTYAAAEKAMVGLGMSPDLASLFMEMNKGLNDGIMKPTQARSKETTTPTTLEEFSKTFAAAYKA
jgi:uncharacterized protein YbjT (DUF2867 family)